LRLAQPKASRRRSLRRRSTTIRSTATIQRSARYRCRDTAVEEDQRVTPLKLPPAGFLDAAAQQNGLKGEEFLNVGYGGDVPTTGQPNVTYDGVRKVSTSTYMALEANWLWLSMNAATGDGGDCYGDSGGPNLLASDKTTVLALVVTGDAVCRATTKDYASTRAPPAPS
jgi:hypothetical protein